MPLLLFLSDVGIESLGGQSRKINVHYFFGINKKKAWCLGCSPCRAHTRAEQKDEDEGVSEHDLWTGHHPPPYHPFAARSCGVQIWEGVKLKLGKRGEKESVVLILSLFLTTQIYFSW